MLLHRCLVLAECFQGFLATDFICLEMLNGFIVKKNLNMGNVNVCEIESIVHVCLCVIFVAALRDTYTHSYTSTNTHLICVHSPKHI